MYFSAYSVAYFTDLQINPPMLGPPAERVNLKMNLKKCLLRKCPHTYIAYFHGAFPSVPVHFSWIFGFFFLFHLKQKQKKKITEGIYATEFQNCTPYDGYCTMAE